MRLSCPVLPDHRCLDEGHVELGGRDASLAVICEARGRTSGSIDTGRGTPRASREALRAIRGALGSMSVTPRRARGALGVSRAALATARAPLIARDGPSCARQPP